MHDRQRTKTRAVIVTRDLHVISLAVDHHAAVMGSLLL